MQFSSINSTEPNDLDLSQESNSVNEMNFESNIDNNNYLKKVKITDLLSLKKRKQFFKIICICTVYLSFFTIYFTTRSSLENIEHKKFFQLASKTIPENIISGKFFSSFSKLILMFFSNKDCIMIYISVMYTITHPLTPFKILLVFNILHFIITLLKCILQSSRPFWLMKTSSPICLVSYANPSIEFFIVAFFLLYTIISLYPINKEDRTVISLWKKITRTIVYLIIVTISGFVIFVNQLNYLYQIIFTFSLNLIIISVLIIADDKLKSFIADSTQNKYNFRKYQIKYFFFGMVLCICSLCFYFLMVERNINVFQDNLFQNENCKLINVEHLGISSTFMDITYILGTVGAFWGMALTVENGCHEWWIDSYYALILKAIIVGVSGVGWILLFDLVLLRHNVYEYNFLLNCIKYFGYNFIVMGVYPTVHNCLKNLQNKKRRSKTILMVNTKEFLKDTIFVSQRFVHKDYNEISTNMDMLIDLPLIPESQSQSQVFKVKEDKNQENMSKSGNVFMMKNINKEGGEENLDDDDDVSLVNGPKGIV